MRRQTGVSDGGLPPWGRDPGCRWSRPGNPEVGEEPEVAVHISTADVGRKGEGVMEREYRELRRQLRRRNAKVVISGLLPVPRKSESRNGERWRMNAWLRDWSRGQGFRFLDHWDLFRGRCDLYKKDG